MSTKERIEKAIDDLFESSKKITQESVARKCKISVPTVRYHWKPFKKAVREMNHIIIPTLNVSRTTKWKYTRKQKFEINRLFVEDCLQTMKRMPDNFLDCVVTSPPYQRLRTYNGHAEFNFKAVAKQLYRTMKHGAVLAWIVGDSVENARGKTGTPFRQLLAFQDLSFHIHEIIIFEKNTSSFPAKRTGTRYTQIYEQIFILTKGKPKTVNLICDKPNRWHGWTNWSGKTHRTKEGALVKTKDIKPVPSHSPRNNIWRYNVGAGFITKDKTAHKHPAIMPQKLAEDLIVSYSNPEQIIYDPFAGSSTVLKAARKLRRRFVGSEINPEYAKLFL